MSRRNIFNLGFASRIPFFHIAKFLSNLPKDEVTHHHLFSFQTIKKYNRYKIMIASYAHLLNLLNKTQT